MRNKTPNNFAKNDWNKSKFYNNSNSSRNNSDGHENSHNNTRYASKYCFGTNIQSADNESDQINLPAPPIDVAQRSSAKSVPENESSLANRAQAIDVNKFIVDSGCIRHVVSNKENFINFTPGNVGDIMIADGKKLCSQGLVDIKMNIDTQHRVTLKDVLYCPDLHSIILSVKKATENNIRVIFEKTHARSLKTTTQY